MQVKGSEACPVRVHDQCMTSEVLGSLRCDCKGQLDQALASIQEIGQGMDDRILHITLKSTKLSRISISPPIISNFSAHDPGMVIYLPQEGRGIGLANKIAAYALQETGVDTVDANRQLGLPDDARVYGAVAQILKDLSVSSIKLMTNNPRKIEHLSNLGINIVERMSCASPSLSSWSKSYVKAKINRMGHMLSESDFCQEVLEPDVDEKAKDEKGRYSERCSRKCAKHSDARLVIS